MLKRMLALLLALCVALPLAVFAEDEEEELSIIEDVDLDAENTEPLPDFDDESFDWDAFLEEEEVAETVEDLSQLEVDTSINPADLELNPNLPGNVINILLIGVDTHAVDIRAESNLMHGDVNMVLSLNTDTGDITLTSFLRDLYVEIPGYRSKAKLNAAYNRGGGQLAMRTINHNFDLNVQHYVAINFYGVAAIIDSLGGIDIDMTRIEANAINAYIKKNAKKMTYDVKGNATREPLPVDKSKGKTEKYLIHCDGLQALMYARLRKIDNDFARTQRQRHLLELLAGKVLEDIDLNKMVDLVSSILPYVITDMNAQAVVTLVTTALRSGLIGKARAGGELFQQFSVPNSTDKGYGYGTTDAGASVVTMNSTNWEFYIRKMHTNIYGEYYSSRQ